jgi:hypothetical protein
MQQWRKAHPGYSRRRSRVGKGRGKDSLHEFARDFASRDEIDTQFYLVVGLVSHLTEVASRDEIASEIRRLNCEHPHTCDPQQDLAEFLVVHKLSAG